MGGLFFLNGGHTNQVKLGRRRGAFGSMHPTKGWSFWLSEVNCGGPRKRLCLILHTRTHTCDTSVCTRTYVGMHACHGHMNFCVYIIYDTHTIQDIPHIWHSSYQLIICVTLLVLRSMPSQREVCPYPWTPPVYGLVLLLSHYLSLPLTLISSNHSLPSSLLLPSPTSPSSLNTFQCTWHNCPKMSKVCKS